MFFVVVVQWLSCVQLQSHWPGFQASPSISWSLLKLMSIESVMPSNHLILCCPLLSLPSLLPSISVFSHELPLRIRWPKYWSFSFSISPSSEYSGLISFRIDCSDLALQGSTPAPQLGISFSAHSLFYCPALTSICDHWKIHNFVYMDLCRQSNTCFLIHCLDLS